MCGCIVCCCCVWCGLVNECLFCCGCNWGGGFCFCVELCDWFLICCCEFWVSFWICICDCCEFLLDRFWVEKFGFNIERMGLIDKGDEFCFIGVLFVFIFWGMGKGNFWDELFFIWFGFKFFDDIFIEIEFSDIVGVFIFEVYFIFLVVFIDDIWSVCWFCELFVIVVVSIVLRFGIGVVDVVEEFVRIFCVDFWFILFCGCCLFWFVGMFWFVRFNFWVRGVFFIKDFVFLVRWFEKEDCVVWCNIVVLGFEFFVFLDLLLFCFDILFIVCCCKGFIVFNGYVCILGLEVILVFVGVIRFKVVLIWFWEEFNLL